MGENVFRGGISVGTTSSYSLPTIKGASGTTLISDSNGDLYWGTFGLGSIGGSGTSYYIPKWTGASGATGQIDLSNSRFYDDGVLGGFNIQNPGNFPGTEFAIESTDINTFLPLQVQRLVSATGTSMQLNNADFFTFISGTAPADSISIGIRSFAGGAKKYNVGLIGSVIGSSEYPMTSNVPENSNIGIFATIQSSSPYQTNPYYYGLVSEIFGPNTSNSVIGILSSVSNGGTGSKYAIQLKDGTQGVGKFLKSITSDGKANWATITTSDITGSISGSGTSNYIAKWSTGSTALGNSQILDDGSNISVNTTIDTLYKFKVYTNSYDYALGGYNNKANGVGIVGYSNGGSAQTGVVGIANSSSATTNTGVVGSALGGNVAIGVKGFASGASSTKYGAQFQDGTEGVDKFLKSITSDGKANWATITTSDVTGAIGGGGTLNYVTKWNTGGTSIIDSQIIDNGTVLSIGTTPDSTRKLLIFTNSQTNAIGGLNTLSSTGIKYGIDGQSYGASGTNIGGRFTSSSGTDNYSVQLQDGTEGADKFLKSITSDGKANWSTLPIATGTTAGTIKVGSGLSVDGGGILSVTSSGGVTGSAASGQLTFWNGTTSIAGDSNLTYDSTNNVLKIEGTGGGFFVDISGDPSPGSFPSNPFTVMVLTSEGKTGTYNPNRMIGSSEGPAQDAPNVIIQSSNPSFPHNGINGPNIAFSYSDDANSGSMSGIIGIVATDGTLPANEDGSLMVFGTRPETGTGGPYDPKEGIRIGKNQFTGIYYKPGPTQSPPAMLTVGTNVGDSNTIGVRESSSTPSQISDYGQFYVSSTDKKPYFLTSGGTAYDLTATGGGAGSTATLGQVMTAGSTASTDLNMANYNINGVTTIKSANNVAQIQTINMINASLLNLMYNT